MSGSGMRAAERRATVTRCCASGGLMALCGLLIGGCAAAQGLRDSAQGLRDSGIEGFSTSQPTSQTASGGGVNVAVPVAANEHQRAVETHSNTTQTGAVPVSLSGNTGIAMTTTVGAGIVIVFIVTAALGAAFLGLQEYLSHVRDMARIKGLREQGIEGLRGGGA